MEKQRKVKKNTSTSKQPVNAIIELISILLSAQAKLEDKEANATSISDNNGGRIYL